MSWFFELFAEEHRKKQSIQKAAWDFGDNWSQIVKYFIVEHLANCQFPLCLLNSLRLKWKKVSPAKLVFTNVYQSVYNPTVGVHVKTFLWNFISLWPKTHDTGWRNHHRVQKAHHGLLLLVFSLNHISLDGGLLRKSQCEIWPRVNLIPPSVFPLCTLLEPLCGIVSISMRSAGWSHVKTNIISEMVFFNQRNKFFCKRCFKESLPHEAQR